MADSSTEDRNLPASKRKLDKARGDGQVARSRDFGHFIAIGVCGAVLVAFSPWLTAWLHRVVVQGLRFDHATLLNEHQMGERAGSALLGWLIFVIPFGTAMSAAAVAGSVAIGGWNFTLKPIVPQFSKLNPWTGLKGLLSRAKLIDAMKGALLALVLGLIGGLYLKQHVGDFTGLLSLALPAALQRAAQSWVTGLSLMLLAVAGFAAIDVPLQRYQLAQRLKMSHQEVKQEHKELEGNQAIKAKMRARMREVSRRRMLVAVPKADMVVMNPTHYAVALKYDDQSMAAPRVVAKGTDLLALKIRDVAREASVPVLESPLLARALYAHAELDREIPAALFAAVAQVLAYVYQLRAALAGKARMPDPLPELPVPIELDPHHVAPPAANEDLE